MPTFYQGQEPGMEGTALADDESHSCRHDADQNLLPGSHPLSSGYVSQKVSPWQGDRTPKVVTSP